MSVTGPREVKVTEEGLAGGPGSRAETGGAEPGRRGEHGGSDDGKGRPKGEEEVTGEERRCG